MVMTTWVKRLMVVTCALSLLAVPNFSPRLRAQAAVLPAPLYYLAADQQIHRVEIDAVTVSAITNSPTPVQSFDISPTDGAIVYLTDNNLILVDAQGQNPQVLFEGGVLERDQGGFPTGAAVVNNEVTLPRWSPDGQQIVFGYGGINLITRTGGQPTKILPNGAPNADAPADTPYGATIYRPESWSPTGENLLISIAFYPEGGSSGVLNLNSGQLATVSDPTGATYPCCTTAWSADGSTVYIASPYYGMFEPGLWRVNPTTGEATVMIDGMVEGQAELKMPDYPYQTTDGRIFLFYNTGNVTDTAPVTLAMQVMSADGTTFTPLRTDSYTIMAALWDVTASGAVILDATNFDYTQGQHPYFYPMQWLPASGAPAVALPETANYMRWGLAQ